MDNLVKGIRELKKTEVGRLVDSRIREFEKTGGGCVDVLFKELCFCILTANFDAEKAIRIQDEAGQCFIEFPERKLAKKLRKLGYRFPNTRAAYIVEARKHRGDLKKTCGCFTSEMKLRDWFVNNVKGLGYKEASHFLRNIGFKDLAIIDFHIIDLLVREDLIEKPKSLNKKRYFEIEAKLRELAEKTDLNLAELDLYLWYIETGKILK
jgi:N-glycosylase/DNA lyase